MMLAAYLKKYRSMLLCSIFFFYIGCGVTLSLLRMDCAEATKNLVEKSDDTKSYPDTIVEYAVVILSSPDNVNKRDTIRSTWVELARNIIVEKDKRIYRWNTSLIKNTKTPEFIKVYFVLGVESMERHSLMKLISENERTNDLVLVDNHSDNYYNLSQKMLKTIQWFSEHLKNLKYLIKTDDDSFVRVDLIIRDLEAFAPSMSAPEIAEYISYKHDMPSAGGLYWGYFNGRARVQLTGKWEEQDWFLCDNYLPYALGGGYVISKQIVDYVGHNSHLLSPYNSEDVSMGVWTAPLRGINRVHDLRFDTEWTSRGCSNDMIIRHKQDIKSMQEMYENLLSSNGNKLCSVMHEKRKSYRYKWNVLPSGCCK